MIPLSSCALKLGYFLKPSLNNQVLTGLLSLPQKLEFLKAWQKECFSTSSSKKPSLKGKKKYITCLVQVKLIFFSILSDLFLPILFLCGSMLRNGGKTKNEVDNGYGS